MPNMAEPGTYVWPTVGCFIDDYSNLPKPTTDMVQAKSDIDIFGYCILAPDMLPPVQRQRLLDKLVSQAQQDGIDPNIGGSILGSMQNKGEEYLELLDHPRVLEVVSHVIGEHFQFQTLN